MDNLPFTQVPYIVIDFETVTQPGSPPEPIELGGMRIISPLVIDPEFEINWLIRPPEHISDYLIENHSAFRAVDFRRQPWASETFMRLDSYCGSHPFAVIAHNASYDASFLLRHADSCPHFASMPFLDTVRLARHLLPDLISYRLDSVAGHFDLAIPPDRHRALPDVQLTCQVFLRLLAMWDQRHNDKRLFLLRRVAGINTEPNSTQPSLFG